MILPIYTYDHPLLRKTLRRVTEITDEITGLVEDMFETMHGADGIGLAANQVGRDMAMTLIDLRRVEGYETMERLVLINPEIESFSDETAPYEEGCLSLPELRVDVIRPTAIQVRFFDADMKEHAMEADGLLARVIQHETDHLNGIYFTDRLSPMKRAMLKRRLLEIKRGEIITTYPLYADQNLKKQAPL